VTKGAAHVFYRRMVCSTHKRFGCIEVMAPTNKNILSHVMVNMENYREITGHTLKVTMLGGGGGGDRVLVETTLGPENLQKHDATNIFYYHVPLHHGVVR
jgi:hypothetical protein